MSPGQILNCINIRCNILGLVGSRSVQIDINSRLDERYFSVSSDNNNYYSMHNVLYKSQSKLPTTFSLVINMLNTIINDNNFISNIIN